MENPLGDNAQQEERTNTAFMDKAALLELIVQLIDRADGIRDSITSKLPTETRYVNYFNEFKASLAHGRASVVADQGHADMVRVSEKLTALEEYLKEEAPDSGRVAWLYSQASETLGVAYNIEPGVFHPH